MFNAQTLMNCHPGNRAREWRRWAVALLIPLCAHSQAYDLVLRGGRVVDGTGHPAYFADVAIEKGRIVSVGKVKGEAKAELDANGLMVAPGFIDVHTHVEGDIEKFPGADNYVMDGVTTVVTGNCGGSESDLENWFHSLE